MSHINRPDVFASLPPASEAMYFHGEPLAHLVQFQERERLGRIDRTARAILNRKVR